LNTTGYKLVTLHGGIQTVHSMAHGETFHPVIGPVAEAEALHVRQLRLRERLAVTDRDFIIWDVGLGAAANALTVLHSTRDVPARIRLISFDRTLEPLQFAMDHAAELGYPAGYEPILARLLAAPGESVAFDNGAQQVDWQIVTGDFPTLLHDWIRQPGDQRMAPAPDAILFDPFSPARNPEMWCYPLFAGLYGLLDPARPAALATYSRSTMLRVTLLLAGFRVGVGHATGEKDETTVAANTPSLIVEPLGRDWLARVARSTSAEPMWEPVYRQRRLRPETREQLERHPQFA
jgi:tRNA U34 5-methylaminomethyl-2-thiouridine-forming methyltransferase MnmC